MPHIKTGRPRFRPLAGLAVLGLLLAGCAAVGTDYRAPAIAVPDRWQGAHQEGSLDAQSLAAWWKRFNDPVLDGLIADALSANNDLATARAKLREARAKRDMSRAGLGPSVTASASASRSKSSTQSGTGSTSNLHTTGFDASWELDLFGATRRSVEASEADLQGSAENLRDVQVSLVAEVATNFVELRTAEQRLAVAEANLASQTETYDLVRWRRMAGLVSDLDEAQARTDLESTRAVLPSLHTSLAEARNRLAILLDRSPGELDSRLAATGTIPVASSAMAVGIPADTLRQRPDVRLAERELAAQTARLGAAQAARYPSLSLTGSLGLSSLSAGNLFDSGAAARSLLASLAMPIFDSGYLRANVRVQDALVEQYRLQYRAAVLTALEDVENALVTLANTGQRRDELAKATDSAKEALAIARDRYAAGLIDFESVLTGQRTFINLQDQLASSTGDYSKAQIGLYKALGGGWTADDAATEHKDSKESS